MFYFHVLLSCTVFTYFYHVPCSCTNFIYCIHVLFMYYFHILFSCYTFHISFSFMYCTCSYTFRVLYFVLSIYCFMYYFHILFSYYTFHITFSFMLVNTKEVDTGNDKGPEGAVLTVRNSGL